VNANEELEENATEVYYACCGKGICGGCVDSFKKSGNIGTCPFCKARTSGKTDEEAVQEMMRRVEASDAGAMCQLGNCYYHGQFSLSQDREKAMELYARAAELGYSKAHLALGNAYDEGGDLKKEKFHLEAAAMAGHEIARSKLGYMELKSGNMERAVKHWTIAASAGSCHAMQNLLICFKQGSISRHEIDSTLTAYNNSCAEMRSEARDNFIRSEARDKAIRSFTITNQSNCTVS
jgi:TPR repeat protein